MEYARNSRKYYYASVTFIDEQVGRIVDELKKKGMYDNALICFVCRSMAICWEIIICGVKRMLMKVRQLFHFYYKVTRKHEK